MAFFGTNSAYNVEQLAKAGDTKARLIQEVMAYQIGKFIGSMAAVLKGQVNAIILTGGIAHNQTITHYIRDMVEFIAPVVIYPGEDELRALAINGIMLLKGEVEAKPYTSR